MKLEVLIPFLLLPPGLTKDSSPPIAPALERLLSRSVPGRAALPNAHSPIFERFGFKAPYPHAPMMALADGLPAREDAWMFAEPVHLVAGLDGMTLFPSSYLDVTASEAAALMPALNAHFAADQICFHPGQEGRWYVRHPAGETPATHGIEAARVGMSPKLLPRSSGKLNWSAMQNEAQMVLYHHPLNEAREAVGKPTINGIWFWGGGTVPAAATPTSEVDIVVTDSQLVTQLATHAGLRVTTAGPLELFALPEHAAGTSLLVFDQLERPAVNLDMEVWASRLRELDTTWFQGIERALVNGKVTEIHVRAPAWEVEHAFTLTRRQFQFGFWRRPKPLNSHA